jgi:SAM-dependent methyltransferase
MTSSPIALPEPDPSVHPVGIDHSGRAAQLQLDLLRYFGLNARTSLLEIGCGIGRLAHILAPELTEGRYVGFDIKPSAIEWLNANYVPLLPNFSFDLVEVHNRRYRPAGNVAADELRFPYDDASFTMSCSFSVFTHMHLGEIANYLRELSRVLTRDGLGVMTFFLIRPEDGDDPAMTSGEAFLNLGGGVYAIDRELPERGIAFSEDLIKQTAADAGLRVVEDVRGYWRGNKAKSGPILHKDVLALTPL